MRGPMGSDAEGLRRLLMVLAALLAVYAIGMVTWQGVMLTSAHGFTQVAGYDVTVLPALALSCACAGLVQAVFTAVASVQKRYCVSLVLAVGSGLALLVAILAVSAAAAAEELGHFTDVTQALLTSRADYVKTPAHWDAFQRQRGCCGVDEASDWESVIASSRGLPMSCCAPVDGQAGMSICFLTSNNRHRNACAPGLRDELRAKFELACFVTIGQLVLQIASLGVLSAVTHRLRNDW